MQDDLVVTGPNFQQLSLGSLNVTPTNGIIDKLQNFLGGTAFMPALQASVITASSQLNAGSILNAGMEAHSIQTPVTASTTQTLAAATQLTRNVIVLTTVAVDGDAVKLFPLDTTFPGMVQFIINNGAKKASVFPGESGTKIDGGSAGAAVTITNGNQAMFINTTSGNWISCFGGALTKAT